MQLAAAILAAGISAGVRLLLHRKPMPPEERERRRRAHLSAEGRIIDGTVLDATTRDEEGDDGDGKNASDMIFYQYEIAGVIYESSQDVTHLREHVDLRNWRVDLPASIRYDARNPANSIVVSESWSGLRAAPSQLAAHRDAAGNAKAV
ncbi:MAG: hypothetical protein ACYCSN_05405 [Acidobacteriaceae bacterium]